MKQLLQSTFVLVAIFALVVLQVVNTCQLGNLEEQVIQQGKRVDRLAESGVKVRGAGPATASAWRAESRCARSVAAASFSRRTGLSR